MLVERSATPSPANSGRLVTIAPGLSIPGFVASFAVNEEVFAEGAPAEFVYRVISGTVRTIRLLDGGRRQISGFHFAGDTFGLESCETHRYSAEAVGPCQIALVSRRSLERSAERDGDAARQLWALTSREMARLLDHLRLLSCKSAVDRVAAFLVNLSKRNCSATVDLPMSRVDIGDHLGLTLETVSRALQQLVRDRIIELPTTRRVVLRNAAALAA
jgi:CRP/FNR family nitrogen fixation transcriptional regulator